MKGLIALLLGILLSLATGKIVIPLLKKLKAGQVILSCVESHKNKGGTPTMGGLFFILSATIVFLILSSKRDVTTILCLCIGLGFMVVGFLDDYIKLKYKRNLGLRPYQKIIFQLLISVIGGLYLYRNGLTHQTLPFLNIRINLKFWIIPFSIICFIATVNCVNLTDGLDGLCGGVSCVFLTFFSVIMFFTKSSAVSDDMLILSLALCGSILGFLFFNTHPAKVFMGDTGSLSIGGFIASMAIFTGNAFLILILGIMFVLSGISVIIQVLYFKKTKGKRIFKMAPFHHHLEMSGLSEERISFIYKGITFVCGVALLIFL